MLGIYSVFYCPAARKNAMKIVPVIKCSDLQRSLHFYTEVLDFERNWPGREDREMANGVVDLVRDRAELQLLRHAGDGVFRSVNRVFIDNVGERYATFRSRGLEYATASRISNSHRAGRSDVGPARVCSDRSRR
jgi:catechol 2,3-dioxygenase-like lactoylglutathione lyase family enzyme